MNYQASDKVIQTPLQQLPYTVSQIQTTVNKLQLEIVQYLEDNIDLCLDQYRRKKQINEQLKNIDSQFNLLESIGKELQKAIVSVKIIKEEKIVDNCDKIDNAIRNYNYEQVIQLLPQLQENKFKYTKLSTCLIGIPNKANKEKIKQLFQCYNKLNLQKQECFQLMEICLKILIQKSFKMYFEQKVYSTNRNQPTYYSDIIQLYQKSFNCSFRLLSIISEDNHLEYLANKILDRFNQNILQQLVTIQNKERSLYVVMTFREIQSNNLLHLLTYNYCKQQFYSQLSQDVEQKTQILKIREFLGKNRQILSDNQQDGEYKSKIVQYNENIMKQIYS